VNEHFASLNVPDEVLKSSAAGVLLGRTGAACTPSHIPGGVPVISGGEITGTPPGATCVRRR